MCTCIDTNTHTETVYSIDDTEHLTVCWTTLVTTMTWAICLDLVRIHMRTCGKQLAILITDQNDMKSTCMMY
jgi:hypothetical protein